MSIKHVDTYLFTHLKRNSVQEYQFKYSGRNDYEYNIKCNESDRSGFW